MPLWFALLLAACGAPNTDPEPTATQAPAGDGEQTKRVVVHRETPPYGDAARAAKLGDVECTYVIDVDAKGLPTRVAAPDCPPEFADDGMPAMEKWRWEPGEAETVKITVRYKFRDQVSKGPFPILCKVSFRVDEQGAKHDVDLSACPDDRLDYVKSYVEGMSDLGPNRYTFEIVDVPKTFPAPG
ncbi:MAG: hypothetical protein EP330_20370 [Deltaproteobacteria bacterium]|nr:MAG: hypothetical protein EP330_20370 [Deltaproteobacteria bacterium]